MTIKFNSRLLIEDLEKLRKRQKLTPYKMSNRLQIAQSTLNKMITGEVKDITVHTLARMLDYLGETDISKYIYDDGA